MKYPYSDTNMKYDMRKHRYILTTDFVQNEMGIDISEMTPSTLLASNVIDSLLDSISLEVYTYLYQFNYPQKINWIIAKNYSAREIIKSAMETQLRYVLRVGDLGYSTDKNEQDMSICKYTKQILQSMVVEETGCILAYAGEYWFNVPSYEVGEY